MNEWISIFSTLITNFTVQSNGSILILSTEALSSLDTVYFKIEEELKESKKKYIYITITQLLYYKCNMQRIEQYKIRRYISWNGKQNQISHIFTEPEDSNNLHNT